MKELKKPYWTARRPDPGTNFAWYTSDCGGFQLWVPRDKNHYVLSVRGLSTCEPIYEFQSKLDLTEEDFQLAEVILRIST